MALPLPNAMRCPRRAALAELGTVPKDDSLICEPPRLFGLTFEPVTAPVAIFELETACVAIFELVTEKVFSCLAPTLCLGSAATAKRVVDDDSTTAASASAVLVENLCCP